MIRAFTGPTELTPGQRRWAACMMSKLIDADVWRSGCAFGIDSVAAYLALAIEVPSIELYAPAAPHNEKLVATMSGLPSVEVTRCAVGRTQSLSYRYRNAAMLKGADQLVAFVWMDMFYRSGEWMTINIADRIGIKTTLYQIPER